MFSDDQLLLRINHGRFIFCMMLIIGLAFLRTAHILLLPVIVFIAISLLMVLICSKEELIAYMCCLFPMLGIMQNLMAMLIVALGVLIRIKEINLKAFIPLILMSVWELLHAGQTNLSLYGFLQDFSPLIALSIVLSDQEKDYDGGFIIRSFACITVICSFFNLLACSKLYGYSISSLARLGNLDADYDDFQGLINPNTNSYICLIALCSLLLLRFHKAEIKSDKYIILFLLVFILLSQSKSAIVCVVLAYIFFFILGKSSKEYTSDRILRLFGVLALAIIGSAILSNTLIAIIQRFTNGDLSTGRNMISLFYFDHIKRSPTNLYFGIGLHKYTEHIKALYDENIWQSYPGLATMAHGKIVYKPCHLAILELIVVWGLPGLIFLSYQFIKIIKIKEITKNRIINYIPLIIIAIYCLQSGFISSGTMLQTLIIIVICITYPSSPEEMEIDSNDNLETE